MLTEKSLEVASNVVAKVGGGDVGGKEGSVEEQAEKTRATIVDKIHKNLGYVPFFYKGQCYCTIGWVDF
jgi:hypothetical protein